MRGLIPSKPFPQERKALRSTLAVSFQCPPHSRQLPAVFEWQPTTLPVQHTIVGAWVQPLFLESNSNGRVTL